MVAHENDQQRRRAGEIGERHRPAVDIRQREIRGLRAQGNIVLGVKTMVHLRVTNI